MAEALAVEAHEVDGRQVGLALHAELAQREHRRVAVAPARQLDDEHEPAAHVAVAVLARQPETLDAGERLAVGGGDLARARRASSSRRRSCDETDRARDVGQAVVEAEAIVVEPAHVRRPALVALGVDAHLQRLVAERHHPALAGRQLLVRVEPERGRMTAPADRDPVAVPRPERLTGVLDDRQTVPRGDRLERRQVGRVAEDVHRQQRPRALGHGRSGRAADRG